ncbi:MAG: ABC transporter ATP-binding protein [Armatimonadota bacterium]|nr:ABC transporter ATP-binding protein [Armatimonadota bacterium]MDR7533256.1 ABC transporter ATP-binding protein [Armatimonadota bacterium]MDR7536951.1 ABC transporter ATP-binding protein [Armatimonadota bacterium]
MAAITLRGLTKRFGPVVAVDDLDLEIQEGELITLLGPSGCGKTTTLRLVAGFEMPDAGEILFGGDPVTLAPPERRNVGIVFQNYALFPHLTVADNVAFGLQMRRESPAAIARRVSEILERVQLRGLERRYPHQLSGGQQQRVALARALVINPAVLLLDEPLANLDAKLREEMRFYIRHLQREFGITTIYVTHDQAEAMVLADRIAVLRDGALQQVGEPEMIYRRPANAWVAEFIGLTNFIAGEVAGQQDGHLVVRTEAGTFTCRGEAAGGRVLICVRPEALHIGAALPNRLRAVVRERVFLGNLLDYRMEGADGLRLRVQADPSQAYPPGTPVGLAFAPDEAWVVPAARG